MATYPTGGTSVNRSLETMITPLTKELFGWGELENSILFCVAGIEIISVFILVKVVSKKFKDRTLILFGGCLLSIGVTYTMYILANETAEKTNVLLPKFICGLIVYAASLPFLLICSISLFTKMMKKEIQGLSQGLRRSVIGIGTIIAPIWTGATLSKPYLLFGVMLGMLGVSFSMLLLSFGRLIPPSEMRFARNSKSQINSGDEKQPLLA